LTSHKGIDLHAASALLVMQERLAGGARLVNLLRCELHTFRGRPDGWDEARLLATGRFYNPNKHHFGVFRCAAAESDPFSGTRGGYPPTTGWPGAVRDTDLEGRWDDDAGLYDTLLGGKLPTGCAACDIVGFSRGQTDPVLSGVLWRLVIRGDAEEAAVVGEELAVARHRKQGLLVNPHMDDWFVVDR